MLSINLWRNFELIPIERQIIHVNIIITEILFVRVNEFYYEILACYSLSKFDFPLCFAQVWHHPKYWLAIQPRHLQCLRDTFLLPQVNFKTYVWRSDLVLICGVFVTFVSLMNDGQVHSLELFQGLDLRESLEYIWTWTIDFSFRNKNCKSWNKTSVAPPHVMDNQFWNLFVRFFLILVLQELLEWNHYCILIAWWLEIFRCHLWLTYCYFSTEVSLYICIGLHPCWVAHIGFLKNVVYKVIIIIIICTSICKIGKRREVLNLLGFHDIDVILN